MSPTRARLILSGAIKPHTMTDDDRKASQQRAIAARKQSLNGSINVYALRPMKGGV
jgi:hypothetical protein